MDSYSSGFEVRTKTAESLLQPLIEQTTVLSFITIEHAVSDYKKGKSRKGKTLCNSIQNAVDGIIRQSTLIAQQNPYKEKQIMTCNQDVHASGADLVIKVDEFCWDPLSKQKQVLVADASKALLLAFAKLLSQLDEIDVMTILSYIQQVRQQLSAVGHAETQMDLQTEYERLSPMLQMLDEITGERQNDLRNPVFCDYLASSRALLRKLTPLVVLSPKTCLRHPELQSAQENKELTLVCADDLLCTMKECCVSTFEALHSSSYSCNAGELAESINQFCEAIILDPLTYNDSEVRPVLEEKLELIISGAALMADSPCTREERRFHIVEESNGVRQALQDLLSSYIWCQNVRPSSDSEQGRRLGQCTESVLTKIGHLKGQLVKAIVDHVSDSYLDAAAPLDIVIEAAMAGDTAETERGVDVFSQHALRLTEVARLSASICQDDASVRLVRIASSHVDRLAPQVCASARTLASRPASRPASDNLTAYADLWRRAVRGLTLAVDNMTPLDDFLTVCESHVQEDVSRTLSSAQNGNLSQLDNAAGALKGRCSRVTDVILSFLDSQDDGVYAQNIRRACTHLQERVGDFTEFTDSQLRTMQSGHGVDMSTLSQHTRALGESTRKLKNIVLGIAPSSPTQSQEGLEYRSSSNQGGNTGTMSGTDFNYDEYIAESQKQDELVIKKNARGLTSDQENLLQQMIDNGGDGDINTIIEGVISSQIDDGTERGQMVAMWTPDQKAQIVAHIEKFRTERDKFHHEVAKWDENGNELVRLAKQMCVIMMEMTDFTRNRGPLKTTMDVIKAAKRISQLGNKLDKLAKSVAEGCPDSITKKDLVAYLQRIALYCHQLNITSKVKADVESLTLVVAAGSQAAAQAASHSLDSATSLITAARNLMNSVVMSVKLCYVASTKYTAESASRGLVAWRMRAPRTTYGPSIIGPRSPYSSQNRKTAPPEASAWDPIRAAALNAACAAAVARGEKPSHVAAPPPMPPSLMHRHIEQLYDD